MRTLSSDKGTEVALVTAAFFGLHPLHVESVAWVAERKDVLYTAFFLGSLLSYLRYLEEKKAGTIILAFLLFLFSLAAKGQAITLPLILVALDWLLRRTSRAGEWLLEKGPFFVVSLLFGLWTILITKSFQGTDPEWLALSVQHSFGERLVFSGYAFTHYLLKFLVPIQLSVIYPYPPTAAGSLAPGYWFYLFPFIGAGLLLAYFAKRKREAAFALLFFLMNIAVTFQVIMGITPSVMNDRYTYLASVGLFMLLALAYREALKRGGAVKKAAIFCLLVCLSIGMAASFQRSRIWKDSLSLWDDVITKYDRVAIAWINRGEAKAARGDFQGALLDFERALAVDPRSSLAWSNRGAAKVKRRDFAGAIPDLNQAVLINPKYGDAYLNRGTARGSLGDISGAIDDFSTAIELNPQSYKALTNRGLTKLGLADTMGALSDFDRALAVAPDYGKAVWGRGSALVNQGRRLEGCRDLRRAWQAGVEPARKDLEASCRNNFPPPGNPSLF